MGENSTNDALRLVGDVIRYGDVDADNIVINAYDRETYVSGECMFGDSVSESDAENLNTDLDDLQAIVNLDPDHTYSKMDDEHMTVDVELGSVAITYGDPNRTLDSVRHILNENMCDSSNIRIYIYDQDSGRDAFFNYSEAILYTDIRYLHDWAEDEDGNEDDSRVVTPDGEEIAYDDVEEALQRVVNLDGYDLPGNMLVSANLGPITVM